jgi:hypothetical protein
VKELLCEFADIDYHSPENRICVINQLYSSINSLTNNPAPIHDIGDKIRFTFIGDALPHKGPHLISQAAQYLTNKNVSFDL